MGPKLIAIVATGVIAGATSALMALAAFSDHGVIAGDAPPSTLLQSASGNRDATLATAPASPVSGDVAAPAGEAGSVARPSQSGGALVAQGVATATPQPAAGGHISVGGTTWPLTATPASSPSASPLGSGHVSAPALPGAPLSTPTATPTAATPTAAAATPTPAPASAAPVPSPPPPARPPLCLLVICLRL
ncbi:MAG TPA: hypothetical protein VGP96_00010 [Candidatus Dormibacteraeota bacterium]|jgi:hypothetical protein|nr:hypothetical protein [Candidatus Dormibacteraeota bacterium]